MPAERQNATERNIPLESARVNLTFSRAASDLVVEAIHVPEGMRLTSAAAGARRGKRLAYSSARSGGGHRQPTS